MQVNNCSVAKTEDFIRFKMIVDHKLQLVFVGFARTAAIKQPPTKPQTAFDKNLTNSG